MFKMIITKRQPLSVRAEKGAKRFYTRANGYNVRPPHNDIIPYIRYLVKRLLKIFAKAVID